MGTKTTRMIGVMGMHEAAQRLEALARDLRAGNLDLTAGRGAAATVARGDARRGDPGQPGPGPARAWTYGCPGIPTGRI